MIRVTHTYVVLEVSPAAFAEIEAKLRDAGYDHAFHRGDGEDPMQLTIDMHGIALQQEAAPHVETRKEGQ